MDDEPISCVFGDDHALLRSGLLEYFRAMDGIRVVGSAANGRATLALIERRRPQVAVVDVVMPGLSGIEVCRETSVHYPATSMIVYTGSDDVGLLEEALDAGARGFVLKSGSPESVAEAIRVVAGGGSHIDAALAGSLLNRRACHSLLSRRETEVVSLLADGRTTNEVARILFLSPATVRTYAENAMHKVDARNRPHLIAQSIRLGLLV